MSVEYTIIGAAFAVCAGLLFFWAVPRYALRHVGPGKPPPLPSGNVSVAGFGIFDFLGISLFFGWYALTWALSDREPSLLEAKNLPLLLTFNLFQQAFMGGIVIMLVIWRMRPAEAFGLRWRRWPWVLLLAPLCVYLVWSFMGMLDMAGYGEWMTRLAGGDAQEAKQDVVRLLEETNDVPTLVLMAVVACIGAPLSEELIFRGYLYGAMKRFTNIPVAAIFSGLLFSAVHMNVSALLPLFVFGVLLVVIYEASGSLWAPIAAHFLFNFVTVAAQLAMKTWPELQEKLRIHEALVGSW